VLVATSLAGWLAQAGGTVGGGTAFGAGVAWLLAALARDFESSTADIQTWVVHGGGYGAVFGMAALLWQALGVGA
jgi:hypothetical protein